MVIRTVTCFMCLALVLTLFVCSSPPLTWAHQDICERILSLYGEHDGDPSVMIAESSTAVAASTPATASVSPATPPSPSLKPNADSAAAALHHANGSNGDGSGSSEGVKIERGVRRGSSNGSCRGVAVRSTDKGTQFRDPRPSTLTSQRKSLDEMKREGEEVFWGETEGRSIRDSKRRKL